MSAAPVFIRVKARKTKAGETWDFRLVESLRIPGGKAPKQRMVVSLGSLRVGGSGGSSRDADAFRSRALDAIRAAGIEPTTKMNERLDALLRKRNATLCDAPAERAPAVSLGDLLANLSGARPPARPFRKFPGAAAAPQVATSFRDHGRLSRK